jgi:hypothetical protein
MNLSAFLAILCHSQSDNDPQEDLAKFGYKLNMKVKLYNILLYFLTTYLNQL